MITKFLHDLKIDRYYYPIFIILVVIGFITINSVYNTIEISPQKSITTLYYVDHISNAHQKVIDKFNEKYAGQIRVEAINLPFDKFSTNERKELLARYLKSKSDRIDVFAVDQIWVPRFAKWGITLDKYYPREETGKQFGRALESCYYADSLAAIPLYLDISLMCARKDILLKHKDGEKWLEELKKTITWERFIKLHQELGIANPFFTFQADDYEGLMCIFTELIASQNSSIVQNGKLYLDDNPAAKKALQLLVDLVNKYQLSPKTVTSFKENESFRYFISNDGLFVRAWPSFSGNDERVFPGFNRIRPELVQVPNPYFDGQKPVAVFGGWNLMISKNSQKINEAIKFIRYVVSPEAQKILFENGQYLPAINQIYYDSSYVAKHPELNFYRNYIHEGVHRPFLKGYTGISDIITFYVKAAINRELSVDEALKRASDKIRLNKKLLQ